MWNTVLFDLDGTLTDSGEGITKSVQYALEKEFGMQVPLSDLRCFVGPPLKEQFMSFAGVSEEAAVRAVERYRERYRPKGIYENYLYDGIKTMLRQLHEEHFTLALTSSKPTMFCRQILRMFNIDEYFTAVVGSDMDGRRTDKYELIEETIRELGMQDLRDEIVMVGDRKYDCVGAASAGIDCIGVTYGFGSRQELEEEWPACIVDSPIELRNVLIGQARSGAEGPGGSSAWGEKSTEMAGRAIKPSVMPEDGGVFRCIFSCVTPVAFAFIVSSVLYLSIIWGLQIFLPRIEFDNTFLVVMTGVVDLILIPFLYMMYRRDEQRRISYGRTERILEINAFGAAAILIVALFSIGFADTIQVPLGMLIHDEVGEEINASLFKDVGLVVQFISLCAIGPACEELIFRGLVYRRVRDLLGVWSAVFLSAVFFGVYHQNLTQGVFAFFFGILLAAVYEHYGTIWAAIAAHAANNLYAVILNALLERELVSDTGYFIVLVISAAAAISLGFYIFKFDQKKNVI
jgi:phosphoglycolate phosphatase-like HAD superfamily hydrolase/membrane protease YdiL (CAAX protease family)